eukprot:CAMPEP_0173292132 /NCGR_PEP_ID=MMETSP1143-20121109/12554_1 /TAXON_ID=483371 /ORGANISM="non described non described, Strain CCMP2298" /LENGTH=100 /DNA_ID=CAMNT_0014231477 /DNA_START=13 /DNA_END=312 /DNA_ORIENTATION=+
MTPPSPPMGATAAEVVEGLLAKGLYFLTRCPGFGTVGAVVVVLVVVVADVGPPPLPVCLVTVGSSLLSESVTLESVTLDMSVRGVGMGAGESREGEGAGE